LEKKGLNTNAAKDSLKPIQSKEGDKSKEKQNPTGHSNDISKTNPAVGEKEKTGQAVGLDGRPTTIIDEQDKKHKNLTKPGSACDDDATKHNEKDPEQERRREAEKLLQQRFKTFDLHYKDVTMLLDAWDRTQGNIFRQPSPSEKSEHEESNLTANKAKKITTKGEKGGDKAVAANKEKKEKGESNLDAFF